MPADTSSKLPSRHKIVSFMNPSSLTGNMVEGGAAAVVLLKCELCTA